MAFSSTPFPSHNASMITNPIDYGVCREMLVKSIHVSGITYWNLALLVPNIIFLVFLSYHIGLFYRLFHQHQFPVVKVLLILVFLVSVVSVVRGFAASIIRAHHPDRTANEILWLLLRFLLLAVEVSVMGFGLFGHGSDQGVGKRIISLSFFLALVYVTIQSCFEVFAPDHAKIFKNKYTMFHHGGMLFWCVTSCLFFMVYSCVIILPKTNCLCGRGFLSLPSNRAFYRYAATLCFINLMEAVGSLLVYCKKPFGLCILNVAVVIYYSLFAPLVYFTFLQKSFRYLKSASVGINGSINTADGESMSSSSDDTTDAVII